MDRFPHLSDTRFPDIDTVDVYKYRNDFDYQRYNYTQMNITMCSVPWDMGEAHIGNRTISGIGNVVFFEDEAARDAWFADIPDDECIRFSTKYRDLHSQGYIDLPIPFDVACRYNYIAVEYALFANDDSMVEYEDADGLRKWFWFIREAEFLAPNATRLHLMIDAWQTFIYSVDITGMVLERGHAPMHAIDADEYLTDPITKCGYLLAPEEDYGADTRVVRSTGERIYNGNDTIAVFVTSSYVYGTWGSKSGSVWQTPGIPFNAESGYPTFFLFGVATSNLQHFMEYMQANIPQFAQTVKCIFFISQSLFNANAPTFTFCDTECLALDPINRVQDNIWSADKSEFAYPSAYADIAKLYTYPYAHIEVSDENGNVTVIRVEETSGTLLLESSLNALFPQILVNAHILGVGTNQIRQVAFKSMQSLSFYGCGTWYDTVMSWNIPMFGIMQDAGTNNDYATHFDRAHDKVAADNEYANRLAEAANVVANAGVQNTLISDNTDASNDALEDNTSFHQNVLGNVNSAQNTKISTDASISNAVTVQTTTAENEYGAISYGNSGAAAINSSMVSAFGSLFSGAAGGGPLGALSGGISGITNQINTSVNLQATGANLLASIGTNQTIANVTTQATAAYAQQAVICNNTVTTQAQVEARNQCTVGTTLNDAISANARAANSSMAANNSGLISGNAGRTQGSAYNAIDCQIAQAALRAPLEFGRTGNAESAASRPMGLWVNTVTESDYAIKRAGDEFLRYGYNLGQYWEFDGNWNVCDKFTYWKLSDFWIKGLNVPDAYVDRLRFFLFGGVTVWRNPSDIGHVSIYQNGL